MILGFDTETSGLPDWHAAPTAPQQPHLVQLAAVLVDERDGWRERAHVSIVIQPDGWTIPERAAAVHGISTETAERLGVRLGVALAVFSDLAYRADKLVAHNMKFDWLIQQIAHARAGRDMAKFKDKPRACTMDLAQPVIRMAPTEKMVAAGIKSPKPPKLAEAVRFFFNEPLDGAHDALVDVRACLRIYRALQEREGVGSVAA